MSAIEMSQATTGFQLFFRSLFRPGRGLAFPCDASGHVDVDALASRLLENYLYASGCVGREFEVPSVVRTHSTH